MRLLTCLTQPLPLLSTEGKPCRKENSPFTPASWQLRFHPWNKSGVHQTVPEARPSWATKWLRMYSHCSVRAASKACNKREGYFLHPTSAACTQGVSAQVMLRDWLQGWVGTSSQQGQRTCKHCVWAELNSCSLSQSCSGPRNGTIVPVQRTAPPKGQDYCWCFLCQETQSLGLTHSWYTWAEEEKHSVLSTDFKKMHLLGGTSSSLG